MSSRSRAVAGVLGAVLLCATSVTTAEAQERIRLFGTVQWIASNTMQVMTPSGTVAVDLRQADQSSYQALRNGEVVIIDGFVSNDRSSVVAREIWRDRGSQAP